MLKPRLTLVALIFPVGIQVSGVFCLAQTWLFILGCFITALSIGVLAAFGERICVGGVIDG